MASWKHQYNQVYNGFFASKTSRRSTDNTLQLQKISEELNLSWYVYLLHLQGIYIWGLSTSILYYRGKIEKHRGQREAFKSRSVLDRIEHNRMRYGRRCSIDKKDDLRQNLLLLIKNSLNDHIIENLSGALPNNNVTMIFGVQCLAGCHLSCSRKMAPLLVFKG